MVQIRPLSDLWNKFEEISKTIHETGDPVILTKNGYGDMVVMSYEAYERHQLESEVYLKLKEAEMQAQITNQWYSHKETMDELRQKLRANEEPDNT